MYLYTRLSFKALSDYICPVNVQESDDSKNGFTNSKCKSSDSSGIVLFGVAVQNAVVLMTFFRQLQDRGESVTHAVIKGCDQRFRPLFMTAITSFIGHLPMLDATGLGADLQKPLAVVVMGGLITSTLLTLFVLPTL